MGKDLRSQVQELLADLKRKCEMIEDLEIKCKGLESDGEKRDSEIEELYEKIQKLEEEDESLRLQLAEFGVNPTNDVDLTDDEEELPPALRPQSSFSEPDNDVDLTDDEEELPPAFQPQSSTNNDDERDGFNIALLGE